MFEIYKLLTNIIKQIIWSHRKSNKKHKLNKSLRLNRNLNNRQLKHMLKEKQRERINK